MYQWANEYADKILENMLQGLLVVDDTFSILHANTEAITLLAAQDEHHLIGMKLGDEVGTQCVAFSPRFFGRSGGKPQNGRYHLTSPLREAFEADVRFVRPSDNSGNFLVFINATSKTAEIDKHFFQSEKLAAMDNIVAGIAHELNNPMTAILGYAELLLATEEVPKRKKRIALIAEEADRCGKIIANMLSFTRSFGNDYESANVGVLLEEVVSLRAYQMRVDGVNLHASITREMPSMDVQPSAIRRLFLNIIHNAHQALLDVPIPQRNLWVSSTFEKGTITVEITDSGVGIDEDVRFNIFDPFFTTRALGEGMGLGLSVAYGIVHEHHGEIWMEPRAEGGTTIKITFSILPA